MAVTEDTDEGALADRGDHRVEICGTYAGDADIGEADRALRVQLLGPPHPRRLRGRRGAVGGRVDPARDQVES